MTVEATSPLVSVIILNWNGDPYITTCLEHVFRQSYAPLELILVDNGSTDGSLAKIEARWGAEMTIIRNAVNRGFTGGMNQGIAASSGEYLLLLNSDVFLQEDYIEQIIARFAADSERQVGMIGGKLYQYVDSYQTQLINNVGAFLRVRMSVMNSTNSESEEYVFGPSGASPMIRRQVLDAIAFAPGEWFDDTYFAYNEDVDLWFRCQLQGWKALFTPKAVGWHMHSASVGGKKSLHHRSDLLQFHVLKNRYMTIIKNYPLPLFWMMLPILAPVQLAVPLFLLLRTPRTLINWAKACRYIIQNWTDITTKRKQIQSRRQASSMYLLSMFRGI